MDRFIKLGLTQLNLNNLIQMQETVFDSDSNKLSANKNSTAVPAWSAAPLKLMNSKIELENTNLLSYKP